MSTIDTTRTIKIYGSPLKLKLLLIGGIVFTGGGALMSIMEIPSQADAIGLGFVAAFGALCTSYIAWRLLHLRDPVIVISPKGIRDLRIAREVIPWRAIHEISTWSYEGQRWLVLDVDAEVEGSLGLTAVVRWSRGVNRVLGITGLCITASGLRMGYHELLETCAAYLTASRETQAIECSWGIKFTD